MTKGMKRRIYKFVILFVILFITNYAFDYFFTPTNIDILRESSIALGVSIGATFGDLIFLRKKGNKKRGLKL